MLRRSNTALHCSKAALALLVALGGTARAAAQPGPCGAVVVVRRAGVPAYDEVTEEFLARVRAPARAATPDDAELLGSLGPDDVVVAVGQRALEAVRRSRAHVVAALSLDVPGDVLAADLPASPELVLRALKRARPSIRRVGVVHGPRTEALVDAAARPAALLDITLVPTQAADGPAAVRELRRIAPLVDAVWLAPDLDVLTPQLFQYALTLEAKRGVPVAAVSRQQVRSGALLAWDVDPRMVARKAAVLVNGLRAGTAVETLRELTPIGLELTVNADVARRLGVDTLGLMGMGARFQ